MYPFEPNFTDLSGGNPCYCRGTMILTERGEVAVEKLAVGDMVVTVSGEAKSIKWIGRRAYSGRFAARNKDVLPIAIRTGALAEDVPTRDLWVSPAHALLIDDLLVPAECLINGATIAQAESVEEVEYFHLEFEEHEVIWAEGAPAESYVECDNRNGFQNAHEFAALYPDDARRSLGYCAPRLDAEAPELAAIRARLARRAGLPVETAPRLGWADYLDDPRMDGAVPGLLEGAGRLPVGWHHYNGSGIACAVLETGIEDGLAYVDLRLSGTPSGGRTHQAFQLLFTGRNEVPAVRGQRWRISAALALRAGSLSNLASLEIGANIMNAAGEYSSWFGSKECRPAAESRRHARTGIIADADAASLRPLLQLATTAGRPIDLTLRLSRPRAELATPRTAATGTDRPGRGEPVLLAG